MDKMSEFWSLVEGQTNSIGGEHALVADLVNVKLLRFQFGHCHGIVQYWTLKKAIYVI